MSGTVVSPFRWYVTVFTWPGHVKKSPILPIMNVSGSHQVIINRLSLVSCSPQDVSFRHRSSHVEVKGYGLFHHPYPAAACCHGRDFHWAHVPAGHWLWTCCVSQHGHRLHNWSDTFPKPVDLFHIIHHVSKIISMYLCLKHSHDLNCALFSPVSLFKLM